MTHISAHTKAQRKARQKRPAFLFCVHLILLTLHEPVSLLNVFIQPFCSIHHDF